MDLQPKKTIIVQNGPIVIVQLLGVESKAIVNLTTFVHQAPFHKLQATLE